MSDIEKIRLWAEGKYDPDPSGDEEWLELCVGLADEIERLRASRDLWEGRAWMGARLAQDMVTFTAGWFVPEGSDDEQ